MLLQNIAKGIQATMLFSRQQSVMMLEGCEIDRCYKKVKSLAGYYRREGMYNAVIISTAKNRMDVSSDESATGYYENDYIKTF